MAITQTLESSATTSSATSNTIHGKKIGLWTLVTLVAGNLVGAGAFMLPAALVAFGSLSIFGWLATSIGALILSLIFAGLSSTTTHTGGPHVYVGQAFGKTAGFFTAWSYWVLSWISNAGLVVGAIGYISPLFGGFDTHIVFIAEIALLIILSGINLAGMQFAGRFEAVLTICKVIPLIILPVIGIFFIEPQNFIPFNATTGSTYAAINATAYLTLWCFIGLETGTVPGADVKNPQKTIPRAILIGTSLAAFIYIIGTIAIIGVVPKAQLAISKAPYADLAAALFGGSWALPVGILASTACIGALNGWIMIVSRIARSAADDNLFPAIFKSTTKTGAPLWGTIISTVCTIPFMALSLSENLMSQFNFILDFSLSIVLIIYLACVAAYVVHFKKSNRLKPINIILATSGLLFCVWTITQSSSTMLVSSISIIICGLPVWLYVQRKHAQT